LRGPEPYSRESSWDKKAPVFCVLCDNEIDKNIIDEFFRAESPDVAAIPTFRY